MEAADTLPTVEKIGAELAWDGQMSLDFVDADDGQMMIECNPSPTDGILLMTGEELERGLLEPQPETLLVEPGGETQLDFAVFGQIFQRAAEGAALLAPRHAAIPGTDKGWRDAMPQLYSFLFFAKHERLNLRKREQLFVAMADGITWDGQGIPGLPANDAAYWRS